MDEPIIIPIAGGKGGVGKSFLAANLAMALASLGQATVAVDLDLGCSNLHSMLGLPNSYAGIGDYAHSESDDPLEAWLVTTSEPNLRFLSGDARMPFIADLNYTQVNILQSQLKGLPAQFLVLDLSAGTHNNTLDFFNLTNQGVVVTTSDSPALMNMLVFVKHCILRKIDRVIGQLPELSSLRGALWKQTIDDPVFSMKAFHDRARALHLNAADTIVSIYRTTKPRIVYNLWDSDSKCSVFHEVDTILQERFLLECEHIGLIPYDPTVRATSKSCEPFLPKNRTSDAAQAIIQLAKRFLHQKNRTLPNSAVRLTDYARSIVPGSTSL